METRSPQPEQQPERDGCGELEELVAVYLDRLNSGERLDPVDILAEEPDLGSEILRELEAFLDLEPGSEALGAFGDYRLERQIGRGGMGIVYEAWQGSMNRRVALKVLPRAVAADTKSVARFVREAQVAGKLSHPNIVSVHGMGVEEQVPYYAMELVEGETLAQVFENIQEADDETETPFGKKGEQHFYLNLAKAFAEVADGLQHAHSHGIVHRDIKPSNLILETDRLRLLDFGLARLEGQESLTLSGDFVGTPAYMSPEQARRTKVRVDYRTDVYSMGATLYEAFTGRPPFRGRDYADTLSQIIERDPVEPRKVNPRVPRDLETVVLKCLRKEAGDRYGTAEALAQDLRRFVRGDAIEARPESALEVISRRLVRARHRLIFAGVLLLLVVLGALWGLELRRQRLEQRKANYHSIVERAIEDTSTTFFPTRLRVGKVYGRQTRTIGSPRAFENRLRPALEELERAIDLVPEHPGARYLKAQTLWMLGADEEALEELDKLPADFIPGQVLRARVLNVEDDDRIPRTGAENNWTVTWLRASRALEAGDWRKAADSYTTLIDEMLQETLGTDRSEDAMSGLSLEIFLGRGIARFELGENDAAVRDFVRAHDRWPGALLPVVLLGQVYIAQGKLEEAQNWFLAAYEGTRHPEQAASAFGDAFSGTMCEYADYHLGWCQRLPPGRERSMGLMWNLSFLGREPEVVTIGKALLEKDPNDALVHQRLSIAYEGLEDRARAREHVEMALELGADDPYVLFFGSWSIGWTFGEAARAELLVRRTLELEPEMHFGRAHVGWRLDQRGRSQQAVEYLEAELEKHPGEGGIRRGLCLAYRSLGEHAKAIEYAEQAVERDHDDKDAIGTLGWALQASGDLEGAEARFRESIGKTRPGSWCNLRARLWLEEILRDRGDFELAIAECIECLDALWLRTPDLRSVLWRLREILRERPDLSGSAHFDRAAEILEGKVEERRGHPLLRASLAFALLNAGERKDGSRALENAKAALEVNPRERIALEVLHTIQESQGDRAASIRTLERLARVDRGAYTEKLERTRAAFLPDLATCASVDALLEDGQEAGARLLEDFDKLADDARRRPLRAYLRGRLLETSDRSAEAVGPLEEAWRLAVDEPEPALALARALTDSDRASEAEEMLGKTIARSQHPRGRLWRAWAGVALRHLELSASQALERFPRAGKESTDRFVADLHWVLETLSRGNPLRIDCGSRRDGADEEGRSWSRDRCYRGRSTARPVGGGTAPWTSYRQRPTGTERQFPKETGRYSIPLPAGTYTVRLWIPVKVEAGDDRRILDVDLKGERWLAGVAKEDDRDVVEHTRRGVVMDGEKGYRLDLVLRAQSGRPAIAAIEIAVED